MSLVRRTWRRCGRWWRPRWRASSRSTSSASTRTWRAPLGPLRVRPALCRDARPAPGIHQSRAARNLLYTAELLWHVRKAGQWCVAAPVLGARSGCGENARLTQRCARLARRAWHTRCSWARPRMRRPMRTWSRGYRSTSTGRRSRAPRVVCACCRRTLPCRGSGRRDAAHAASARMRATQLMNMILILA